MVVDENEMSPHLQRMLQAAGQAAPTVLPILEINPDHALIERIEQSSDEQFADWSSVLLDQAFLADGSQLADPVGFVQRLNALLLKS